jgi:hypothetical protein
VCLETFCWREGLSADAHVLTKTQRNTTSPAPSNQRADPLAVKTLRSPAGSGRYLNVRKLIEGREIRAVEIDSERAPHVP